MKFAVRYALIAGLLSTCAIAHAAETVTPPPLPVEESDEAVLEPAGPHRLFLFDAYVVAGANVIDGDDADMKTLGLVPAARNGAMSLSRDGSKAYVAETYWSRGNRGDRADLFTIYDGRTLSIEKEVALPGRLHVVPKAQQLATSADGKLGYVYDMIPSSSVHVVDIDAGKVVTSVDIPGCALVFPYGARNFGTICGDGTVGAATIPAAGEAKIAFSKPFFDADNDPIFENSVVDRDTGQGWMLSFTGKIYPVKFGPNPVVGKAWSINSAAGLREPATKVQDLAWRPGGGQVMTLHRSKQWLYVLVHMGNHWTHKEDGSEVWVLDAAKQSLVRRIKLDKPASGVVVTQDDKPLLYVFGGWGGSGIVAYDALSGKKLRGRQGSGNIGLVPGL